MQCQDVKNIVECCFVVFFSFLYKVCFTRASKMCRPAPRHVGKTHVSVRQHIYILTGPTEHSRRVRGRTLNQQRRRFIHEQPSSPLSARPPDGGGGGGGHQTQELSLSSHPAAAFPFLPRSFFFEVSLWFSFFFIEKYYCSSLHQCVTSSSFPVCLTQTTLL